MHQRSGGKEDLGTKTFVFFAGEEKNDLTSWSSGSLSVLAEVKKLRADVALLVPENLLVPRVALFDPSSCPFLREDDAEFGFV